MLHEDQNSAFYSFIFKGSAFYFFQLELLKLKAHFCKKYIIKKVHVLRLSSNFTFYTFGFNRQKNCVKKYMGERGIFVSGGIRNEEVIKDKKT